MFLEFYPLQHHFLFPFSSSLLSASFIDSRSSFKPIVLTSIDAVKSSVLGLVQSLSLSVSSSVNPLWVLWSHLSSESWLLLVASALVLCHVLITSSNS